MRTAVEADALIDTAIADGERLGLAALVGVPRQIFAIAEAEVYCDQGGIDSLIDRYGRASMPEFAAAFEAVGAEEIADALRALSHGSPMPDAAFSHATALVTDRRGYGYEDLRALVLRTGAPDVG